MIDDLVQDGTAALVKSIREASKKIKELEKTNRELEESYHIKLITINPDYIFRIENPSLKIQFFALSKMKRISKIEQITFPINTLFYEIKSDNKENVLNMLTSERTFFQKIKRFELLIDYTSTVQKTLLPDVIRTLEPLTNEQRQIWNSKRLEILF